MRHFALAATRTWRAAAHAQMAASFPPPAAKKCAHIHEIKTHRAQGRAKRASNLEGAECRAVDIMPPTREVRQRGDAAPKANPNHAPSKGRARAAAPAGPVVPDTDRDTLHRVRRQRYRFEILDRLRSTCPEIESASALQFGRCGESSADGQAIIEAGMIHPGVKNPDHAPDHAVVPRPMPSFRQQGRSVPRRSDPAAVMPPEPADNDDDS